ncbi:FCD domain-containing protein [Streptomyces sp. NPDC056817]|uniref:FCD domain-containing protein n=1 Tax=Streptomyces sp. NPDC056817 TaxID=3345950 RepID=UPI00368CC623
MVAAPIQRPTDHLDEHERMCAAIERRDPDAAASAALEHVEMNRGRSAVFPAVTGAVHSGK